MEIKIATSADINIIMSYDKHITKTELLNILNLNRVFIIEDNCKFIGWLRYNLFWDNTPFMNMLYILEEYRRKGLGKELVEFWEVQMKKIGYELVMTSTASDEYAQHFYNKLGYSVIGGFTIAYDPYELILSKKI